MVREMRFSPVKLGARPLHEVMYFHSRFLGALFSAQLLRQAEQIRLFEAFLSRTQLIEVYYRWRPNLLDEGHNHVLELAVAAGDAPILTFN
jgi:hypothetical protein